MATWRLPATTETDANSPVTQELMEALANNPVALAEQASGAPKIAHKVTAHGGSGVVDVGGFATYGGLTASIHVANVAGTDPDTVEISLSDDGSAFEAATEILSADLGDTANATLYINFLTGSYRVARNTPGSAGAAAGTLATPSGTVSHVRFDSGGMQVGFIIDRHGGDSAV